MALAIWSSFPESSRTLSLVAESYYLGMKIYAPHLLCSCFIVSPALPMINPVREFGIANGRWGPGKGLISDVKVTFPFVADVLFNLLASLTISSISFFARSIFSCGPSTKTFLI